MTRCFVTCAPTGVTSSECTTSRRTNGSSVTTAASCLTTAKDLPPTSRSFTLLRFGYLKLFFYVFFETAKILSLKLSLSDLSSSTIALNRKWPFNIGCGVQMPSLQLCLCIQIRKDETPQAISQGNDWKHQMLIFTANAIIRTLMMSLIEICKDLKQILSCL